MTMSRPRYLVSQQNLDLFGVLRESDGYELKPVGFRRSKRASTAAGIHPGHVQYVYDTSPDQRDLLLGRRSQHAELPATVVAHFTVFFRVS